MICFFTAGKDSKYGVFSGPYFPVFGLNTEIYGVFFLTQCFYSNVWYKGISENVNKL